MAEPKTYSISVRLRRTTVESAFVKVPVNADAMQPTPDQDGKFRLDPEKVMEVAVNLGAQKSTQWIVEGEPIVEPHPIQVAPPETKTTLQ